MQEYDIYTIKCKIKFALWFFWSKFGDRPSNNNRLGIARYSRRGGVGLLNMQQYRSTHNPKCTAVNMLPIQALYGINTP